MKKINRCLAGALSVVNSSHKKNNILKKEYIINSVTGLLIILFVYAAVSKLSWYIHFKEQIEIFPYINKLGSVLPWAVPTVELIITLLLLLDRTRLIGLYSSGILLTIFTIYIGGMLLLIGKDLPCSCGGIISKLSWKQHLIFNVFFIGSTIAGISAYKDFFAKSNQHHHCIKNIVQ